MVLVVSIFREEIYFDNLGCYELLEDGFFIRGKILKGFF